MTIIAARPETTSRKTTVNLFLTGYADDDTLDREELAREWDCTVRTVRNYQYEVDGLPFLFHAGKVRHRAGSARDWMRRRERRLNQSREG